MSVSLGPVHYIMHNRILVQDDMSEALLALAEKNKWVGDLRQSIDAHAPGLTGVPLEQVLDQNNIHGGLSALVANSELRFSSIVNELLKENPERLPVLSEALQAIGRKYKLDTDDDIENIYDAVSRLLLDGMPCDRPFKNIWRAKNFVRWELDQCPHLPYWDTYPLDVDTYYILRQSFLDGVLEGTGYLHKLYDADTFSLERKHDDMAGIDILMNEHDNILVMLDILRSASLKILNGHSVIIDDLRMMIDFIRLYADKTHHGKEEEFLFKDMVAELGPMGDNLIRHGMLVEHDLARLYVYNLENAVNLYEHNPNDNNRLDILVSAGSYIDLLQRHIEKENTVVFPFGKNNLSQCAIKTIDESTIKFEEDEANAVVRKSQLAALKVLKSRYLS